MRAALLKLILNRKVHKAGAGFRAHMRAALLKRFNGQAVFSRGDLRFRAHMRAALLKPVRDCR